MAQALAEAGANVAVTARNAGVADAGADDLRRQTGARIAGIAADVTDRNSVERLVEQTVAELGRVDILVNNAGVNIRRPIEQLHEDEWDQVLDTNLKGAWLCCRAVSQEMKSRRWGRVINLSSMLCEVALAGRTPYCASKGGMTLMTKALALEWAKDGINVNAIAPGPFATEMNLPLLNDPEVRASMAAKVPLGRWADPAELGPLALFLASDASSYVTGSTFLIDGGYTAQ
jgi:NAD(P)-dependent dehydrogenase (short-subunit alcohol dehydrogenase family)